MPGQVLPARPVRWVMRSSGICRVTKRVNPFLGENWGMRAKPVSMTTHTPSMVSELSAMEVASTILRSPARGGETAASCSRRSKAA